MDWRDRSHFYALSSRLMRQILVDHARSRGRRKRGGGALPIAFDETAMAPLESQPISCGWTTRCTRSPRPTRGKCRVVELRFFGGLSVDEEAASPGRLASDGAP